MQSLILKLEADVAARKGPRSDIWPVLRIFAIVAVITFTAFEMGTRSVDTTAGWAARAQTKDRLLALNAEVDALKGELELKNTHIDRLERAYRLSSKYGIGADLAIRIEEIALAENVDPKVAFEMVRVESGFNRRAVSPVGAVGFTQLMPATARIMQPGIQRAEMFDTDTNLRLGFRFFRSLLDKYDGNVKLALLAYNRGPGRVDQLLKAGIDPNNGYSKMVLGK